MADFVCLFFAKMAKLEKICFCPQNWHQYIGNIRLLSRNAFLTTLWALKRVMNTPESFDPT